MGLEVVELSPMRVATVRHIGSYRGVHEAFERLMSWARPLHPIPDAAPVFLTLYHDDPNEVPEEMLRSDAALVVPEGVPAEGAVQIQIIPGGNYARWKAIGPYENLGEQWRRFFGDFFLLGYQVGEGCLFDQYMNNPDETAPEALETHLFVPIASSTY